MNTELISKVGQLEQRLDGLIKPEVSRQLVAPFLDIPGKVGLWYAGDVQRSTGDIYDSSGQGRTLTYNGNPIFKQLSNGIAYIDLDGTGDYFSRADETDLDILGTEAHNVGGSPGLTAGGWVQTDDITIAPTFFGKLGASGQYSWQFIHDANGDLLAHASVDGTALTTFTSTFRMVLTTWTYIVFRFTPSTEMAIFRNGDKQIFTTSIPASLFNSNAGFAIGANLSGGGGAGAGVLNGKFSIGFLSANILPDVLINSFFQQTRVFYGV